MKPLRCREAKAVVSPPLQNISHWWSPSQDSGCNFKNDMELQNFQLTGIAMVLDNVFLANKS
jgi:hypothetical protein